MKALVGAFNQEKALVGAFSVIVKTDCETDGALHSTSKEVFSWSGLVLVSDEAAQEPGWRGPAPSLETGREIDLSDRGLGN